MLSLAYRLMSMPVLHTGDQNSDMEALCALCKKNAAIMTRLDLTNVYDYAFALNERKPIAPDDIPNWAPPFGSFFAEWETKDKMLSQLGAFVMAADPKNIPAKIKDMALSAKWVLLFVGVCSGRFTNGLPLVLQNMSWFAIGDQGNFLQFARAEPNDGEVTDEAENAMSIIEGTVGFGMSFMHCKNVRQVDEKKDAGPRWHRQNKIPRYTYKRLLIDPMKEVLRREGRSEETGIKKALHICRGHFATYSEERPLFGKLSGSFWIPDHIRGSEEHGRVEKDYTIKTSR